jgi:hypothetical protein
MSKLNGNRTRREVSARRRCLIFSFFLSWLTLDPPSFAAEYEQRQGNALVRLEADKIKDGRVELRLADEVRLTVRMEGDDGLELRSPEALTNSLDWQVRRESGLEKASPGGGRVRWQERFRLSPLKPGDLSLALAPLRFRLTPDTERWEEVVWQPIPVHVSTEIYRADVSELRDVAPPEEVPPAKSLAAPLTWIGLAAVFLLLLLSGWALGRRRGPWVTAVPPGKWALAELERIRLPDSTQDGVAHFYTHLSDVLRRYLELRYHVPAPEQTTAEFLEEMRRSPHLPPEQQSALRDFLGRCDLVKFARVHPSPEECTTAAQMARAFVQQTANNDGVTSAKPPGPPPAGQSAHGTGCN